MKLPFITAHETTGPSRGTEKTSSCQSRVVRNGRGTRTVHQRSVVQIFAVMSLLLSLLLIGRPNTAFADARSSATAMKSPTTTLGTASSTMRMIDEWRNLITNQCLDDSANNGLRAADCNGSDNQKFLMWQQDNNSFSMQNVKTGSCIQDSPSGGLRASYCIPGGSYNQDFFLQYQSGDDFQLQNLATGSCIDHSSQGLRGYYCLPKDYFQYWTQIDVTPR